MQLSIRTSNDVRFTVTVEETATVKELKEAIAAIQSDLPVERQRLIYAGRVLKDADTLGMYKIVDGNTVHLVRGNVPGAQRETTASSTAQASQPTHTPSVAPTASMTAQPVPPPQFNPFGMGGAGMDPYGLGTADPMMMDPAIASQMMQDPAIAQAMSTMMQNPQFLDSILAMHPGGVDPTTRAMMQSPQFRAMMTNPQMLQAMAQMNAAMRSAGVAPSGGMPPPSALPAPQRVNPTPGQPNPFAALFTPPAPSTASATAATPSGNAALPPPADMAWLNSLLTGIPPPPSTTSAPSATPSIPPEERYQSQLAQLNEMGFWDAQKNIRALQMTGGNVHAAVEYLLSNP